jgi:hypothetical protein
MAAKSLRLTANDLWPKRVGSVLVKKCRPATNKSVETAKRVLGVCANNAQSSPGPSTTCAPHVCGLTKWRRMRSNSPPLAGCGLVLVVVMGGLVMTCIVGGIG